MGEWIDIERWSECRDMERPGWVFELANREDRRMLTGCTVAVTIPFGWESGPVKFRLVPLSAPRHSSPLPIPHTGTRRP